MSGTHQLNRLLCWEEILDKEVLRIRDATRDWVQNTFKPMLQQHHREGTFPVELLPDIGAMGFLGPNLHGYGCLGISPTAYGLMMQELERGDSGLRSLCSVQGSLVMWPIAQYGSEHQKNTYLPKLAKGEHIGCFGLTEHGAGSDPAAMQTTAAATNDGYILNGIKAWITNAPIADLCLVWAKVPQEDNTVAGFLISRGTPGLETPPLDGKFSLRASPTGEIHLTDCFIPKSARLPQVSGLKGPLSCLNEARFGIAFGALGAAMDCFDVVLEFGQDRIVFGRPLAQTQLYQQKLADIVSDIAMCQCLNLHYAALKQASGLTPVQVSLMKRQSLAAARRIASESRAMLGAIGITDAYPVIRHMMNLESVYTYEGTHEVHTLAIGRALTDLSAF